MVKKIAALALALVLALSLCTGVAFAGVGYDTYKTGVENTIEFTGSFEHTDWIHVKMLDAATGEATGTDFAKTEDDNVSVSVTNTKVTIVTGPNAAPGTYVYYYGAFTQGILGGFKLEEGLTVAEYTLGEVEHISYATDAALNVLHIKSYDPATGAIGEDELKGNFTLQSFTTPADVWIIPKADTQPGTYICYVGMKTNVLGAFKLNPAPVVVPRPDTVPYDLLGEELTIEYDVPAAYTDETIHMYAVDDEDVKQGDDLYPTNDKGFTFARSGDKLTVTVAADATTGAYVIYHGAISNYENWIGAFSLTLKHTVTFAANGGAAVANATVVDGETVAEPLSLKDNVTPYCWTDEGGNVWDFANDTVTEDVTLTAQRVFPYNQENSMKVYNEDETVTNRTENYHIYNVLDTEQANDLANAAGFKVTGAFKDTDGAFYLRVKTNQGGVTTPAGKYNVVFWNPTTHAREVVGTFTVGYQYTVTFNSVFGSAVAPLTVWEGETITAPTAPTKVGYNFAGWYKDNAYATAWNFATDVVSADVTLYAKWTAIPYHYYHVSDNTVVAPKTGDPGIALYFVTGISSLMGLGYVGSKKKEF